MTGHKTPTASPGSRKWIQILSWIGCGILVCIVALFLHQGYFREPDRLQALLQKAGIWGPFLFIVLMIIQVIVPILPGGVSGALGMLCFGTIPGFIYSYIGVILGSLAGFWLVRQYGKKLLNLLMKPEKYEKYLAWLDKGHKFDIFFAAAIFFPLAPDDILCMIAGLSNISVWKFLLIICIGKPISMFLYSYGLVWLMSLL